MHSVRRLLALALISVLSVLGAVAWAAPATAVSTTGVLVARPAQVDFHTKRVGTENYKRTKITNTGETTVLLVVTAGLPDDFGFGLLPGQTCPVLAPGELGAGDSCYAVVRFSPTEFFVGWQAEGEVIATAYDPTTDPTTWIVIDKLTIQVFGEAVL